MADLTTCLRPNCSFAPLPTMTLSGDLVVDPYCSLLCRMWAEYALALAHAPTSPRAEWESQQMLAMDAALNRRRHPSEIDEEVL